MEQNKMETGGYKYSTKQEAEAANRRRARERYWNKREEILLKKRTDPILKEKRRQEYRKYKQEKEKEKEKEKQIQIQIQDTSQDHGLGNYMSSVSSWAPQNGVQEKLIKTPNFIMKIV